MTEKKKSGFQLPHVYILLMFVMLIVVVLSWFIPSGEYATVEGSTAIDPTQFTFLDNVDAIGFFDFFKAIPTGITEGISIIVSVLMVTGALAIYESSGAIGIGIHKILDISKGKENIVVAVLTLIFAILGTIGFGEGGLPFIPLAVSVVMALGYDRMAGMATAQLGFAAGFTSGVFNLFTTGVSQTLVGLPMFSAWQFRTVMFVAFYIAAVLYLLKYCKKIKKNPAASIVKEEYMLARSTEAEDTEKVKMTWKNKITLIVLGFAFVFQAFGTLKLGWGLIDIAAFYIVIAIIGAIINGISPNKACMVFAKGAANLLPACLTIGMARAVYVLMSDAKIIDTLIKYLSDFLQGKESFTIILIVYLAVIVFNFFVVSGSGKAMILMPILGPLATLTGINQQAMVVVFQLGDGFTNYLFPTSGALVAGLSMCDVSWESWFKFAWKLFAFWIILGLGFGVLAQMIGI